MLGTPDGDDRGIIICGQCRRPMVPATSRPAERFEDWRHAADNSARCPQGAADAVRIASAALAAAGGHPVWMGDGRARWATR